MREKTILLVCVLAGCGSGGTPATGDAGLDGSSPDSSQPDVAMPGGLAKDDFLTAYRYARCSYLARCGLVRSLDACVASTSFNQFSGFRYLLAAVDRAVVTYDGAAAAACVAAIAAQACTFTTPRPEPSCSRVFTGTVPAGGGCMTAEECAPAAAGTAACVGQPSSCGGCCYGICDVVQTAAAGGSCAAGPNGVLLHCPEGQYCHIQTRTCTPVAAVGEPCDRLGSPQACRPGLFCSRDPAAMGYKCYQPAETGASCNPANVPTSYALSCESLADHCPPASVPGTETCKPRVPVGGSCAANAPCIFTAYCDGSVCRERIGLGEPCTFTQAGTCAGDLGCVEASDGTATCVLPPDSAICPPPP